MLFSPSVGLPFAVHHQVLWLGLLQQGDRLGFLVITLVTIESSFISKATLSESSQSTHRFLRPPSTPFTSFVWDHCDGQRL
jgi:hypothetical protein